MKQHKQSQQQGWWHTNCPVCKRIRAMVLWAILMWLFLYFFWW